MKNKIFFLKSAVTACFLLLTYGHAATVDEAQNLVQTMKLESVLKDSIQQINQYQIKKRLSGISGDAASPPEITGEKAAQLKEFSDLIEKKLDWQVIGPKVVQTFAKALTTPEAAQLNAFAQTQAGQIYVEKYQGMAAPLAIELDAFVDNLVDTAMDSPDAPFEVIRAPNSDAQLASQLVIKLRGKEEAKKFNATRVQFLAQIDKFTQPKSPNKASLALHKKRMEQLGQSFSLEQITWRTVRLIQQSLSAQQISALSAGLDDPAVLGSLQKLNAASQQLNVMLTQELMGEPEVLEVLGQLAKGPK